MKFSKYNIIHTTENQEHILFNSLWGSTFVISPSVKQAIESSNPTLLTEEENRLFIKYNALIPDEYNESCIYNHFYNKSRYGKKCLTATVLLTWSCNFRCIYCYEGAGELRCENMTKNRAGAIANFLIKCSEEQRGELIENDHNIYKKQDSHKENHIVRKVFICCMALYDIAHGDTCKLNTD